MRRILGILMILAAAFSAAAESSPKYEMRGVWLTTVYGIDWPSETGTGEAVARRQKAELDAMLRRISDAGINAVFFQVRPMADALYNSTLEPSSSFLTGARGKPSSFDPLAYCVERCHELGMECHAWINPFRVGTRRPDTQRDRRTSHLWMSNTVNRTSMIIFNPALEGTVKHLLDVCREVATSYDIDGIVFDDYFYNPEFLPENEKAADWRDYLASGADMSMADWRRENVNRVISEVYNMLLGLKDGKLRFGISPQGIAGANGLYAADGVPSPVDYGVLTADSQFDKIYSDPVRWLKDGIVDYVSPQIYWLTTNERHPYEGLSLWWNDVAELFGRHCFVSQKLSGLVGPKEDEGNSECFVQVAANRNSSYNYAPGSVLYSASSIASKANEGFGRELRHRLFYNPALVPPMGWREGVPELHISNLRLDGSTLRWDKLGDSRYVVYSIPEEIDMMEALSADGDGISSEYIVGITYRSEFSLDKSSIGGRRIAVAPYDRYGNEWAPTFIKTN